MPAKKCTKCRSSIPDKQPSIFCCYCKKWFDLDCANVTAKYYASMEKDKKDSWTCNPCCEKKRAVKPAPIKSPLLSDSSFLNDSEYEAKRLESQTKSNPQTEFSDDDTPLTRRDLKDFQNMVAAQLKMLNGMMNNFQKSLSFFNDYHEEMKKAFEEKAERIINLERENEELKVSLRDVTARLNTVEQQSRSANVEIQCVPEHKTENLVTTVIQLGSIVGCKLNNTDILQVTRVAKKDKDSGRPRSIIAKLSSPRLRDALLAGTITYNKKNPKDKLSSAHIGISTENPKPIYVSEHLSNSNKALHAAARLKGKELKYKFTWIRNGRVFMRKTESSDYILINSKETLNTLK